jgi:hypothetical protein
MNSRNVSILGVLVLIGAGYWWSMSNKQQGSSPASPSLGQKAAPPTVKSPSAESVETKAPATPQAQAPAESIPKPAVAEPPPAYARKMHNEYVAELDTVRLMLSDYRTLMQENPVGTNAEIMKALMGDNPKHAKLGPPEGQGLNEKGELTDRWGTPYFFHQNSATEMEVRSAGPDRKLWTPDDVVVK